MRLLAEGLEVEGSLATTQLVAQRRETRGIDSARAQDETVRTLFQFQVITRLNPKRLEHLGWESNLTFCCNLD
jgi:hypothetical protein